MLKEINIVWIKRDLRLQDHEPLLHAEAAQLDYLPIYVFEPSALAYPDSSMRHQQFIYHSLMEMNAQLKNYDREVIIFHAEAIDVFEFLSAKYQINTVYSYQESGILSTWNRDKRVAKFLKEKGSRWNQYQRDGIIRGIRNRVGLDQKWYTTAHAEIIKNTYTKGSLKFQNHPFQLSASFKKQLEQYPESMQKPGSIYAWKYLASFCSDRGKNYSKHISKPMESRKSCGRISPYLAWGNISIRQAYQFVKQHPSYGRNKRSFNGLLTRLKWHCHFIQKFEVECDYETICVNRGYEAMTFNGDKNVIQAWEEGRTGFPLVDACMRCLIETGWINFRMRAMLVSTFCHLLDCNWKDGVYHLSRLFLDYEPGIHYTQFQMQAGTTGINTVRIYNPVKQSKDHDPDGVFIKKWIPELRELPVKFIHEPWTLTELDKQYLNLNLIYPAPVVDLAESGKKARAKIWEQRKEPTVKAENGRIIEIHTRPKTKGKAAPK